MRMARGLLPFPVVGEGCKLEQAPCMAPGVEKARREATPVSSPLAAATEETGMCPRGDAHPPEEGDDAGPWQPVLPSDALRPGGLAKVFVAGEPVLLARLEDGTVAAATAVCPHRGEDLSGGMVYQGTIDCPLHHYLYDLRTGVNRYPRNVFPAALAAHLEPLPLYPVKEEGGWLWVTPREALSHDSHRAPDRTIPPGPDLH